MERDSWCFWICFNFAKIHRCTHPTTTLDVWSWSGPCCWLIEFYVPGHDSSMEHKTSPLFGGLEFPRSAKIWQLGVVGSMPWVISLLGCVWKRLATGIMSQRNFKSTHDVSCSRGRSETVPYRVIGGGHCLNLVSSWPNHRWNEVCGPLPEHFGWNT